MSTRCMLPAAEVLSLETRIASLMKLLEKRQPAQGLQEDKIACLKDCSGNDDNQTKVQNHIVSQSFRADPEQHGLDIQSLSPDSNDVSLFG